MIGWINIALYCAVVLALVKPLGYFMTRVFNGERTFLSPVLRPMETVLYRIAGVDERREQHWLTYTIAMLLFHAGGFVLLYALLRLQGLLPFNPQGMSAVAPDLAFNTAVSFTTNTNWQNYGGESTLSHLVPHRAAGGWVRPGRRASAERAAPRHVPVLDHIPRARLAHAGDGRPRRDS
jgi:K+-transporting ATPase ATPase A chain